MTVGTLRHDVRDCIGRGLRFLLDGRSADGWWWDYDLRGPSNAWITAYVGCVLAELPDERARAAAYEALETLLPVQTEAGGWSYDHIIAPTDPDTTGWVLRLAAFLGRSGESWTARAWHFISQHVHDDGLVSTYVPDLAASIFALYPMVPAWDGWCSGHDCVTAAVAGLRDLPEHPRLIETLLARQLPTGQWRAYWWEDQELSTAFAVEALAAEPGTAQARAAAARWAAGRIGSDGAVVTRLHPEGSPFATALAARTIAAADGDEYDEARAAATAWLVAAQRPDGSWVRSARLRMPLPWDLDWDNFTDWTYDKVGKECLGTIARDTKGLHTAATVVKTLIGTPERY